MTRRCKPFFAFGSSCSNACPPAAQRGAALLMAMLTVALVASLAAAGFWVMWRSVEVETQERQRGQSHWLLVAATDWARVILREDARAGGDSGADHLAEPWAIPLLEARMSSFVSANAEGISNDDARLADDIFLSGHITDQQGRLNVTNLLDDEGKVDKLANAQFVRLFEKLGLPPQELQALTDALPSTRTTNAANAVGPLKPQRLEQLAWLGLSARSLQVLAQHICVLPVRTPVNLNTASEEVLTAVIESANPGLTQKLVQSRASRHFEKLDDVVSLLSDGKTSVNLSPSLHSVNSRFFEVRGRLRWGRTVLESRSLIERNGVDVKTLWSDRGQLAAPQREPLARPYLQ